MKDIVEILLPVYLQLGLLDLLALALKISVTSSDLSKSKSLSLRPAILTVDPAPKLGLSSKLKMGVSVEARLSLVKTSTTSPLRHVCRQNPLVLCLRVICHRDLIDAFSLRLSQSFTPHNLFLIVQVSSSLFYSLINQQNVSQQQHISPSLLGSEKERNTIKSKISSDSLNQILSITQKQ